MCLAPTNLHSKVRRTLVCNRVAVWSPLREVNQVLIRSAYISCSSLRLSPRDERRKLFLIILILWISNWACTLAKVFYFNNAFKSLSEGWWQTLQIYVFRSVALPSENFREFASLSVNLISAYSLKTFFFLKKAGLKQSNGSMSHSLCMSYETEEQLWKLQRH